MFVYNTKQGDSIERMSALVYGEFSIWPFLYYRNAEIIGDDPNIIPFPAQIVVYDIPTQDQYHIAEFADSYPTLSAKYYGCENFWWKISAANSGKIILSGDEIKIPALVDPLKHAVAQKTLARLGYI